MATVMPGVNHVPLCALCGRPVERVLRWVDQNTLVYVFKFFCHGEQEEFRVDALECGFDDVTIDYTWRAFEPKDVLCSLKKNR